MDENRLNELEKIEAVRAYERGKQREHAERISFVSEHIKKPRRDILLRRRCPECGRRLKKKQWYTFCGLSDSFLVHLSCPQCEYEYAYKD